MSLNTWSARWLKASFFLLFILIGCSLVLFLNLLENRNSTESSVSIQQVRLRVNPILLNLEQNIHLLQETRVRENLLSIVKENGVELSYVGLDGTILLSSSPTSEGKQVNLRSALHYDLNHAVQATNGNDSLNIAFPVMAGPEGSQIGNALFTIPKALVMVKETVIFPFFILGTLLITSMVLGIYLVLMKRKFKTQLLSPIHQLKKHAESILKGQYNEPVQYNRMDEMSELYAMFDLMRTEIMHLSELRIRQETAQKELITNISHDIKTPITTVKAYIEAILEGICSDKETLMEYMKVMQTNTDKTARLVEDLLVHALQELGQISVEPREVYSRSAFETMLNPIGHSVRMNGLKYEEPEYIPNVLIRMDPIRIEQVLSNLVSNALKHTVPGDSIRINAELDLGKLRISIADSGQGIRAQDMPFVFERYFRGNSSPSARNIHEGTGLGLSICKSIIEAHGGHISFSSKEGQGTLFQFTLPIC
ncbi:HAMP domain-containing sensor histidine kinase [Paenibacillus marchantiae]|uniref:sensor histidine kinase n=1 Tax=Paenibacillus marchantiae TaxID=3026433 RepID=UPI00237B1716|nr:HAMP domain-containing sensor histidine kinase [Paenibacillus marchantiae]WDQ33002.1 HAMP domain-containing sensor histidine kinase [Paenibacillus marchantiae]